jgi:hypothetical protein
MRGRDGPVHAPRDAFQIVARYRGVAYLLAADLDQSRRREAGRAGQRNNCLHRADARGQRVGRRNKGHVARSRRIADGRDVGIPAALVDVVFQVGADTQVAAAVKRDPRVQRAACAQKGGGGQPKPSANFFRKPKAEPDLVAVKPPTLVGVGRDFPVDAGAKLQLGQRHPRRSLNLRLLPLLQDLLP